MLKRRGKKSIPIVLDFFVDDVDVLLPPPQKEKGQLGVKKCCVGKIRGKKNYMFESRVRLLVLGWPVLVVVWVYWIWFLWRLHTLAQAPVVRDRVSTIDSQWMKMLLPSMLLPTLIVWAYVNWIGWKFFAHN